MLAVMVFYDSSGSCAAAVDKIKRPDGSVVIYDLECATHANVWKV